MSNIPSSAIPHAWARDDREEAAGRDQASAARSPSLAALAGFGVLIYLVYRAVR